MPLPMIMAGACYLIRVSFLSEFLDSLDADLLIKVRFLEEEARATFAFGMKECCEA